MQQETNKSWGGVLFGMVFLVVGLAAGFFIAAKPVIGYLSSGNWIEVPAIIRSVNLKSHSGDTTTYSVEGTYSYNFNGVTYDSDRISLSSGSDNVGRYWHDLERSLRAQQRNNEAIAVVNPADPAESLLDRTLRWRSIVFGLIFLNIFGGFGSFIIWASLRGTESREMRLQREQDHGVDSSNKNRSWVLAAFGGVFFVMGGGMSLIILPDAIRDKEYGALFVLLFAIVGAGIIGYAFKMHRAYRRFGPTPLTLDPSVPGVGGQLGGRFKINAPGNKLSSSVSTPLQARLLCTRRSRGSKNSTYTAIWQEEVPVYLKQTATGVECTFLFDIPDTCMPSGELSKRSSIGWSVVVEGDFHADELGMFERTWDVSVEDEAAQASNVLSIPQTFLDKAESRVAKKAKTAALNQVPVTEDGEYISVDSKAGRNLAGSFLAILFGGVFTGVGVFTIMDGWWPGYLFLLIGSAIVVGAIHSMGKTIEVKIHKDTLVLYARVSWCGLPYSHSEEDVVDPDQFSLKKTASSSTHNKVTEYYVIEFGGNKGKIQIVNGIVGKKEAQALRDEIINRCFCVQQAIAA